MLLLHDLPHFTFPSYKAKKKILFFLRGVILCRGPFLRGLGLSCPASVWLAIVYSLPVALCNPIVFSGQHYSIWLQKATSCHRFTSSQFQFVKCWMIRTHNYMVWNWPGPMKTLVPRTPVRAGSFDSQQIYYGCKEKLRNKNPQNNICKYEV